MTPWEILLRFFFGWAILMAGGALYFIGRYGTELKDNVSWGDWALYLVLGLTGGGVLLFGDRVLKWTSMPDLVRRTTIGLVLAAAVVSWVRVLRGMEGLNDSQALMLYLSMVLLFSLGMRLAFAEFEFVP